MSSRPTSVVLAAHLEGPESKPLRWESKLLPLASSLSTTWPCPSWNRSSLLPQWTKSSPETATDNQHWSPKSLIPVARRNRSSSSRVASSPGFQERIPLLCKAKAQMASGCQQRELHKIFETSRPESMLAPESGDQCLKQLLFGWKSSGRCWIAASTCKNMLVNCYNDLFWYMGENYKTLAHVQTHLWTLEVLSRWSSWQLGPERVQQPRQSRFSKENDWKSTCWSSTLRKAFLSFETLINLNMLFNTASSLDTFKSPFFKIDLVGQHLASQSLDAAGLKILSNLLTTFNPCRPCRSCKTCNALVLSKEARRPASTAAAKFGLCQS